MDRERRGEPDLPPGPARDLVDLYRRLQHARKLSGGQIAVKTGLSAGYISEVMRGWKCPRSDTAAKIAVALGASIDEVRLASRLAEESADLNKFYRWRKARIPGAEVADVRKPAPIYLNEIRLYKIIGLPARQVRYIGTVTGDIRRVRCADIWVNPENTDMQMARFNEFSVSSIIRYEGAVRDDAGRVIDDVIVGELTRKMAGRVPVQPATAVVTGSGELKRFGVSHIVHVAAVQGEPGAGFRQIHEVGRCVTSVMAEVDKIDIWPPPRTILFPLLGAGQGGGQIEGTVNALAGATIDYFSSTQTSHINTVFFLAYTDVELSACERLFTTHNRLSSHKADNSV
jgi:O-acetyl-ADP-ribose deacetylase (regulator of RNase III)